MWWRRRKHTCGYWDCNKRIPDGQILCEEHYEGWVSGYIDRCPKCHRFKDVMYRLCQDCYSGRPVKPGKVTVALPEQKNDQKVEYSEVWIDGFMRPDKFIIYILELDDGSLYIGYTKDLRKQIAEHRRQKSSFSAGRDIKLQYVQEIATQRAAELRVAELKKLKESSPRQIELMIADFHAHMREFGFE